MLKSPVGALTFLMTDIEGSTRLWEDYPAAMTMAIPRSEEIIHEAVSAHDGYHVVEQGEGDSTLSVFKDATQALRAAEDIRENLAIEKWPDGLLIRVRVGIHTGVADMRQQTYYGRVVNRAARVRAVAHGGQIILTSATRELLDKGAFPNLKDQGAHRLKDLLEPEHLFELVGSFSFPALKTLSERPGNLPIQLTSFIGRDADLRAVAELLGKSRLVTIRGTGGCGKTRLALQVAAELSDQYPDGVFFVDLVPARNADDIRSVLLTSSRQVTLDALATLKSLIVFDNCEHLTSEAASVARSLLSQCPNLTILTTSREPLHLAAESTFSVKPLTLPKETDLDCPDLVAESEAVTLLLERVHSRLPEFRMDESNCRSMGQICKTLQGIPLAIELAAPRLKVLSPDQLASRLSVSHQILKSRDRTEVDRHQTLDAAIDHSYQLLTRDERCFFRSLGTLRSWSIETAEASSGLIGAGLELAESLLDKSLVHRSDSQAVRFYMLESVRQFAYERLVQENEEDGVLGRAADWFQVLFAGKDSPDLGEDFGNIAALLDWCVRSRRNELGLALFLQTWSAWRQRGLLTNGRRYLDHFLEDESIPTPTRARAQSVLGSLAWHQDDITAAREAFEQALGLAEAIGDQKRKASSCNNLGLIASANGDFESARLHFSQAKEGYLAQGDVRNLAKVIVNLGMAELETERYGDAEQSFLQALNYQVEANDGLTGAILFRNLSHLAWLTGRNQEALEHAKECAQFLAKSPSDLIATLQFLGIASLLCAEFGRYAEARRLISSETALRVEIGAGKSRRDHLILRRAEEIMDAAVQSEPGQSKPGPILPPDSAFNLARQTILSILGKNSETAT